MQVSGFPPIAKADAQILILGSMPGVRSLEKQEYYGHPRNSFWTLMGHILECPSDISLFTYRQRCQLLRDNKIALWDVLQSCHRPGSLDASIDKRTSIPNPFVPFFKQHVNIQHVFFNGQRAGRDFKTLVWPQLHKAGISYYQLPSSSPAMAQLTLEQKLQKWLIIQDCLHNKTLQNQSLICY